jgi:hypothetical protein
VFWAGKMIKIFSKMTQIQWPIWIHHDPLQVWLGWLGSASQDGEIFVFFGWGFEVMFFSCGNGNCTRWGPRLIARWFHITWWIRWGFWEM